MLATSLSPIRVITGALLCALALSLSPVLPGVSFAPTAQAQAASDLTKVYFATGWFEKNADGEWDEYDARGKLRYTFREVGRTSDTISLFLKQYGVRVDIDASGQQIFAEWPGQARHVMHRITNMEIMAPPPVMTTPPPTATPPAPSSPATPSTVAAVSYPDGSFVKQADSWTETTRNGAQYRFREIGYDDRNVYLFDGSRNAFVLFDLPGQMIRFSNGGAVSDLYPVTEFSVISGPDPRPVEPPTLPGPPEPGFPEAPKLSTLERATCIATGGTIEKAGLLGAERCTRPYRDAGMMCSDSSQCQGKCIAGTDGADQSSIIGTCQENDNPFGCYAEVRNGQTGPALCVD